MDRSAPYYAPKPMDLGAESPGSYRSASAITRVLQVLLWTTVVAAAYMLFTEYEQIQLLARLETGDVTLEEIDRNDATVGLAVVAYAAALCSAGICFFVWFSRSNKNARALGAEAMEFGPNAWGWFFCPLLNLWKPYQAVTELFVSSQDVRRATMPGTIFIAWWAAWVLAQVGGRASAKMMESDTIGTITTGAWVSALSSIAMIAAGVWCIRVVSSIQAEQDRRFGH